MCLATKTDQGAEPETCPPWLTLPFWAQQFFKNPEMLGDPGGDSDVLLSKPCHKGAHTANLHQCQHGMLPAPQCSAARGRTSHPWLAGQTPLLISSMDDLPSSHSQQSWQAAKPHHCFLPLSHFLCCGSKPISLPINIWANTRLGRELQAGLSSMQENRGERVGRGEGLQIRADMAWHFGRIF